MPTKPTPTPKFLRDTIARHLGQFTWNGGQLPGTHARALADHLLTLGETRGVWAGSPSAPSAVHVFTLMADETLTPERAERKD